ncbi:expressed unknown protein [Seminavis robusta]|uniref:Uncharacterized protein n=1 Tax=Seminavis robusta TaxID=568900 RepID=A0A9N8H0X8_9STRA|nr:expressed unknown protein [Seminavis robusta]|eukprot:Sro7_g006310.1 n/a (201) ;mRNA; r:231035-231637
MRSSTECLTMATPASHANLSVRRSALLRRRTQMQKMTSFRLPKEATSALLHFHSEDMDEPENDTCEKDEVSGLKRRKMALQRNKRCMTSFRLPKDKTQALLKFNVKAQEHAGSEQQEEELSSPTKTATNATKKSRRCRLLQTHKQKSRMNSFRLPKETTKPLLQQKIEDLDSGTTHGREDQAAMPTTQLMRQSSFSARTA